MFKCKKCGVGEFDIEYVPEGTTPEDMRRFENIEDFIKIEEHENFLTKEMACFEVSKKEFLLMTCQKYGYKYADDTEDNRC